MAVPEPDRPRTPPASVPPASSAAPDVPAASPAPRAHRPVPVDPDVLRRVAEGTYHDPHSLLGPHLHDGAVTVRVLRPYAASVTVLTGAAASAATGPVVGPDGGSLSDAAIAGADGRTELTHESDGIWVGVLPDDHVPDYRLAVTYHDGSTDADGNRGVGAVGYADDPYRFLPTLGEVDLHLIGEGRHERLWTVLGAHVRRYDTPAGQVVGTSFAVWAPNAGAVRVSGDFNYWDSRGHAMRSLGSTGVWELFVPEVGKGARYKFDVCGRDGVWRKKADPMARATEAPPATASVVTESEYEWQDADWLADQAAHPDAHRRPMSTYEVHIGSWRQGLSYRELADQLVAYVTEMGFTHVEFLPVMEHPFGGSWGYQVTSYYAPTARYGSPDDFRFLVDSLHAAGIGVIVDWVPAHFPKDAFALARFDGTALYEHPDPRRGEQLDWGTYVFDFGRPQVRNFLVANALYWLEAFHIDGLRVDAVASMLYLDYSRPEGGWVPNQYGGRENLEAVAFLQEMNATVYKNRPGVVTIAEESTSWPGVTRPTHLGGLGFGMKWNMGWMNDSLGYLRREPIHRQWHHHELTFSIVYAFTENFVLPLSHDEVVHGKGSLIRKMPGDRWQQLANLRAYFAFMWAHPGKQLLFMGSEFGQESEWAEKHELDWWLLDHPEHAGLRQLMRDLNTIYRASPALWRGDSDEKAFSWIDANDAANNVFSFVRFDDEDKPLVCVTNFSAVPHEHYRLGLPQGGRWEEVVNTDAEGYGGSGVGNLGEVTATEESHHGMVAGAELRLPPLGTLWLRPAE